MELNKIDRMVRDMLLRFPTLYANRFDAFAEIMTNSCYEWDGDELVYIMPQKEPVTTETMLNIFRGKLAESREKHDLAKSPNCLVKLHTQFITDAERHLHDAEFVAANIDTYATTWCGTTYKQIWLWLFYNHRHGINPYWAINRKPAVVDEEWRLAIKDWLRQLMPAANSMMGRFVEVNGGPTGRWQASRGYETVFNWIGATFDAYTTEADRKKRKRQEQIATDIANAVKRQKQNASDIVNAVIAAKR